jgi:hypothetical protein
MKHNSIAPLRSIPPTRRTLSAIFIVLSIVTAFAAFGVPVDPSWTYQGQLRRNGAAYNGTCDFQFSLWDAVSAGTQQGSTQPINGVNVVDGLFTVAINILDFHGVPGLTPFRGEARWLETSVQCSGDGGFTPLDPRQPITATPYALGLVPGATFRGPLKVNNNSEGTGYAILGDDVTAVSGAGIFGVAGTTFNPGGAGVYGDVGLGGDSTSAGVFGINSVGGPAIWGKSTGTGPAIYGQNTGTGLAGKFDGQVDIAANANDTGLSARGGTGVRGEGTYGVEGVTFNPGGAGVYGHLGIGADSTSAAVWGQSTEGGPAIYGQNTGTGLAGRFTGPVVVEGNLIVQGTLFKSSGSFRIDHPQDPANKFLSHSFVESPDMMNIYNGNVTTDATGSAIVTLPAYFEALNRDYRYQLTVLGQFAQAIVSREIAQNTFEIRTDRPGVKVSWLVMGNRQDAYAQANPIVVEEAKPAEQKGMYLYPAGFGAGEEKEIGASSRPATPQTEQKITKKTK